MRSDAIDKRIKTARNFESLNMERDKRDKKFALSVGGAGIFIGILSIVAVIVMLPLKETRVDLYVLDKSAGTISYVSQFTEELISADTATNKLLSENYLTMHERYNYFDLQEDYNNIQAYNSDDVNKEFLNRFNGDQAPDVVNKKAENVVKISIVSNFITDATPPDRLATIRYKKTIRNVKAGTERTEFWVARFTFRYVPTKTLTDDQRRVNKLGYIVTSWETEKEHGVSQ